MNLQDLLRDLVVVFLSGVLAVVGLRRIGLPPIVGFLVAGLLIGPHALGLVSGLHTVEVIAELGVALLLFTIGLEFSLDRLRPIARFVAVGGTLQVGLTVLAGVLGAVAFGVAPAEGVAWGFVAALSSTAIVLQSLSERGEVNAPHGKLVVGVLIFQDLCIVPMMLAIPMLAGAGGTIWTFAETMGQAVMVVVGGLVVAGKVVPALLGGVARANSREVFILSALLIAAAVSWATASIGLSIALGAFLAGVIIAETEFAHTIAAQVSPFRDAMASVFFVSIGMLLDPRILVEEPVLIGALVLMLVVGKLALAALGVLLMRFPLRVALLTGLSLAQIGEFSFVLIRAAEDQGLISEGAASAFLAASVITMIVSPILVAQSPRVAAGVALLRPLERRLGNTDTPSDHAPHPVRTGHVVIGGLGHGGRTLGRALEAAGVPFLAVDLDLVEVSAARDRGWDAAYADLTSPEALEHVAYVGGARQVVLMLSDPAAAGHIAALLRARHPTVPLVIRVQRMERDASLVALPGVVVIAEDESAAADLVLHVLHSAGVHGQVLAQAAQESRSARGPDGTPQVSATALLTAFSTRVLELGEGHWGLGRSLRDIDLRRRTGALVIAASEQEVVRSTPDPEQALGQGTLLVLAGTADQLVQAERLLRVGPEVGAEVPRSAPQSAASPGPAALTAPPPPSLRLRDLMVALIVPYATTGVLATLKAVTGAPALALYGISLLWVATVYGAAPGMLSAVISFALANVVLVEPTGELTLEWRLLPLASTCLLPLLLAPTLRRRMT